MCKDLNCMCYDDHSECAARIRELEAEIVERRMDYGEDCKRLDARIAELEQQLAAAQERERTLRDALDNMVRQFACTANGKRSTGGLSALEQAFEVLGLDDPHSLDTKEMCDEPGCNAPRTCGWPSSAGYRNTCGKHYKPDPQYMNPEQEGVVERQDDKPTRR